ncbi:Uncharacterized conserved protein YqhQ [Ruminococcus sp. YE71]|uniref:DUF1385 domain-containing protein n=1 Tax=unclassified Ruminococcus TaxID=2608920 RepID=UPI00089063EB|nr:Uncharacterized conserved protein YqhQ [Ruminococcus sp. YE78]SFW24464.1 Uncharacterized conserved protein YqhQ [Ruminococcus sp. YE71]
MSDTEKKCFKTKIGGQAVIEGVMMKGPYKMAMANRMPDGSIDIDEWDMKSGKQIPWYRKTPFVRGIFNFVVSMIDGYKCLSRAADKQMTDDGEEEMTKFEKWLDDKFGEKIMPVLTTVSMIFGVGLAIVLFVFCPAAIVKLIEKLTGELNAVLKNVIEGLIKIAIFIGYTALTSLMPDIAKTYEYHGAEHKTIACYESGDELTPANVMKHTRFHPRCGTSFIFLVLFISILVTSVFHVTWDNYLLRVGFKLLLIPVVTGIAYEAIMLAGKHDNIFTRIFSAPGLWIQRITTSEPNESEVECAIAAMKAVIPEDGEADKW